MKATTEIFYRGPNNTGRTYTFEVGVIPDIVRRIEKARYAATECQRSPHYPEVCLLGQSEYWELRASIQVISQFHSSVECSDNGTFQFRGLKIFLCPDIESGIMMGVQPR